MTKYPMAGDLQSELASKVVSNPALDVDGGSLRYVALGVDGSVLGVHALLAESMLLAQHNGGPSEIIVDALTSARNNPVASGKMAVLSLADTGLKELDLDEVLGWSLEDAHADLMTYFSALGDVDAYKKPLGMIERFLGQNYKTSKEHPEEPSHVLGLTMFPADKIRSYHQFDPDSAVDELIADLGFETPHGGKMKTLCTGSNNFCRDSCLVFTGRNVADVYNHRRKAIGAMALIHSPEAFARVLVAAVERHARNAPENGLAAYVRLNVLSDVPWEKLFPGLFSYFAKRPVTFYDYTKVAGRVVPNNYDITFSFSGTNERLARDEIANGRRVAVVFMAVSKDGGKRWEPFRRGARLPRTFWGLPVVDGDVSDVRPLDPPRRGSKRPCIVGLRWKTPGGRSIDPTAPEFKFVVPAYHLRDRVSTEHQNPGDGELEYLVAPVTPRFQAIQRVD